MSPLRILLLECALIGAVCDSHAQDGALDASFNSSDVGFGNGDGANYWITSTTVLADNDILIAGGFTSYNGDSRNFIARLNADGSLDSGFDPGTGANNWIHATAVQPDGKYLIGGDFTSYNGIARNRIARLNPDGSLDIGFDPGTGADSSISTISIHSGGGILIGGAFNIYDGTVRNHVARLDTYGGLDLGFDSGTGADSWIYSTSIQPDGKVLIGGDFTSYDGIARNRIARLNADGTLDSGFDPGTGADSQVYSINLQADDKIIMCGAFVSYNDIAADHIVRLNTDGTRDNDLDPGAGANGIIMTSCVQSDGKILVGGEFTSYNNYTRNQIARLENDGSLDVNFNPATDTGNSIHSLAIQTDGKVLASGYFPVHGVTKRNIARLNTDGSLDVGFNPGSGADWPVFSTLVQADGKILISGWFLRYNGVARKNIARINPDGSLDSSFDPGTGANSLINSTALQSDGKIIIGGWFTRYDGTERSYIARVNVDGSLDTSFDPGPGASYWIHSIIVQSDDKIIIGGNFWSYYGVQRNGIARLNVDGSLDTSFDPGTGTNGVVYFIAMQPDGKILLGGEFSSFNGTPRLRIARVNVDGTLDTGFDPGSGANSSLYCAAVQSDGKLIIGGAFTSYDGTPCGRIARLNVDGSLDTSFDVGTGANYLIQTIVVESSGKILIGGSFADFNGIGNNNIARLDSDGSMDSDFLLGTGANYGIRTITIQADGRIIIGGGFTGYDGTGRNRIARLLNPSVGIPDHSVDDPLIYPNPSYGRFTVAHVDQSVHTVMVTDISGREILMEQIRPGQVRSNTVDLSAHPPGTYLVTLIGPNGRTTVRLIIQ